MNQKVMEEENKDSIWEALYELIKIFKEIDENNKEII